MSATLAITEDPRAGLPSASGFQRLLNCPGSFQLSRGLSTPEKQWTKDGTKGHAMLAGEEEDEETPETLKEDTEKCERYFAEIAESLGFETGCLELGTPGGEPAPRMWLHDDKDRAVASGEPDRVRIRNGVALIVDFKLGRKAVPAPSLNPQLIGYALLLQEEYGITGAYLQIIQPWAKRQEPAYIDAAGLATWRKAILRAIEEARQSEAPRQAGPHCDYCPARWKCPEANAVITRAISMVSMETPLFPTIAENFKVMMPERKLVLWDLKEHAKKTIKEIDELFKADLEADPNCIPGLVKKPETETLTVAATPKVMFELSILAGEKAGECFTSTLTKLASVAVGGKPTATSLTKDGKAMKETLRLALGDQVKVTKRAGAIERI